MNRFDTGRGPFPDEGEGGRCDTKDGPLMERLIEQLKKGSPEAWDEFVTRFSRLVYSVFSSKSFGFSPEEMEELFHDFMVGMMRDRFRKVRRFEGRNGCSFPSYLKKIAVNLAIDRKKRLIRNRMISLQTSLGAAGAEGELELMDVVESGTERPEIRLAEREETGRLLDLLYRLPPDKLLVLVLILYHRYDRVALGELLHTTRQNIDVIFNRTKNKLQKLAREAEKGPPLDAGKAGGAAPVEAWSPEIRAPARALVLMDREEGVARCLGRLSIPEELLVGLLFLNGTVLKPLPSRVARVLGRSPEETETFVRNVLERVVEEREKDLHGDGDRVKTREAGSSLSGRRKGKKNFESPG